MKTPCEAAQRQLLALTDPDQPPAGVQVHLEACPTCREWRKQVVQLDRAATMLPYPPSTTKSAFLQRLKSEPSRRDRLRWKTWQLTAAWSTAAMLLFVLLYNFAESPPVVPPPAPSAQLGADPWLNDLLAQHRSLARANGTSEQIKGLAGLADEVQGQTQLLAQFPQLLDPGDLQELVKLYGQAIQTGVQRAGALPPGERRQVLEPIVRSLDKASRDAQRRAREYKVGSADHPLMKIATAAQAGKDGLESLLNEAARGYARGPCLATLPSTWLISLTRARADNGARSQVSAADLAQFKRNRPLVEAIFRSGIQLAAKGELVSRAGHCNPLVAALAKEISSSRGDDARVAELAAHLRGLLTHGVAHNLAKGGVDALPGSLREEQLLKVGGETISHLNWIEGQVKTSHPGAWQDIQIGRREVEIAIQGRGASK